MSFQGYTAVYLVFTILLFEVECRGAFRISGSSFRASSSKFSSSAAKQSYSSVHIPPVSASVSKPGANPGNIYSSGYRIFNTGSSKVGEYGFPGSYSYHTSRYYRYGHGISESNYRSNTVVAVLPSSSMHVISRSRIPSSTKTPSTTMSNNTTKLTTSTHWTIDKGTSISVPSVNETVHRQTYDTLSNELADWTLTTMITGAITDSTVYPLKDYTTDSNTDLTTDASTDLTTDTSLDLTTAATTDLTTNATTDLTTNATTDLTTDATTDLTTDTTADLTTATAADETTDTTTDYHTTDSHIPQYQIKATPQDLESSNTATVTTAVDGVTDGYDVNMF